MSEVENEDALLGDNDDNDDVAEGSLALDDNDVDDDYTFGDEEESEKNEANDDGVADESDLESIKARVKEMEDEAKKLAEMQNEVEKQMNMSNPNISGSPTPATAEDKIEADGRSVYVGNVDYAATAEELEAHFHGCGTIQRVTIMCDKFTGHPKGFAYLEFGDSDAVQTAQALDESLFRGRQIKVVAKRTNKPGLSTTNRGRGRGFRGGRGRGYFGAVRRPFRGAGRSRRYNWFAPY